MTINYKFDQVECPQIFHNHTISTSHLPRSFNFPWIPDYFPWSPSSVPCIPSCLPWIHGSVASNIGNQSRANEGTRIYSLSTSIHITMFKSLARQSSRLAATPIGAVRMLTAQAAVFSEHGEPSEVLKTHQYEIDDENLAANAILVKTLGAPVNPSDINQIQGVYPSQPEKVTTLGTEKPSAVAGNEGLFEVLKVGSGVTEFQPGDWAIPTNVNFGTWRTHALCEASQMMKLPSKGLSVNQGATMSVNPLTAYLMLTHYVKLGPEDWVIQNGGNSAVGTYVSQISKILGNNCLSVIRDRPNFDEVAADLEKKGATHVITEEQNNSRDFTKVKEWVKESKGQIKLGLNCVGGKSSTGIARKLGNNGLMLTYGGMSFQPVILPTSLHIFKNVTSSGFWVTQLLKNNPQLKRETVDQIVEWYQEGKLVAAPSVETPLQGDVAEAYVAAVARSKEGKQLVTF